MDALSAVFLPDARPLTPTSLSSTSGARAEALSSPGVKVNRSAETIHPELWRGHQLGRLPLHSIPTGWALLDAQLPGGGWPRQTLTELLLKHPGVGEMRLLATALSTIARGEKGAARTVMLFDPPATPCAWAMEQLGLPSQCLIVVHGREGPRGAARRHLLAATDVLWALEQALRSGHAGAILAWLPDRLRADALRRLQLAAQAHDGPVFLLRGIEERLKPSPAPLRLALHPEGQQGLSVLILKRRGPPLSQPLSLPLLPLAAMHRPHRSERRQRWPSWMPTTLPVTCDADSSEVFSDEAGASLLTPERVGS
jgi:protein ImuA